METNSNFVGNGKSIGRKIQVTLKWEDLKKLKKNDFKGQKLLTLDIIPLKQTSQWGHSHGVVEFIRQAKEEKAN